MPRTRTTAPRGRVLSLVGGRPHLIKAESVHLALVGTGFRHEVLRASLSTLSDYPRDRDFQLPAPRARFHSDRGSTLAAALAACLEQCRPDVLLLYGDLATTAAALPAVLRTRTPVVHVEAGYRSGDLCDVEEATRILVDHAAHAHLAYNAAMVGNLTAEGIAETDIFRVPDPASLTLQRHLQRRPPPERRTGGGGLVTFHHDETFETPRRLAHLVDQLKLLGRWWPLRVVAYARTREGLAEAGLLATLRDSPGVVTVQTLRYDDYLSALCAADFVVTDSSGVQDDCVALGRPCIVVRRASPRVSAPALHMVPEIDRLAWDLPETVTAALAAPRPPSSSTTSIEDLRAGLLGALEHAALRTGGSLGSRGERTRAGLLGALEQAALGPGGSLGLRGEETRAGLLGVLEHAALETNGSLG